jgi:hypothetical protein
MAASPQGELNISSPSWPTSATSRSRWFGVPRRAPLSRPDAVATFISRQAPSHRAERRLQREQAGSSLKMNDFLAERAAILH